MSPRVFTLQSVLNHMRLPSNAKYLDLGCGTEDLTIFIANKLRIKEVYGVDVNKYA